MNIEDTRSQAEIVRDIDDRLAVLAPLVDEFHTLTAAKESIGSKSATKKSDTPSAPKQARRPAGANRKAVLDAVVGKPGMSAAEVAKAAGIAYPTAYAMLKKLVDAGEIIVEDKVYGPAKQIVAAPRKRPDTKRPRKAVAKKPAPVEAKPAEPVKETETNGKSDTTVVNPAAFA